MIKVSKKFILAKELNFNYLMSPLSGLFFTHFHNRSFPLGCGGLGNFALAKVMARAKD